MTGHVADIQHGKSSNLTIKSYHCRGRKMGKKSGTGGGEIRVSKREPWESRDGPK